MIITKWPGIEKAPKDFLINLIEGCKERGWDYDALLGHISSESKFDPAIRNKQPGQSATGLIQVINSTAKALGFENAAQIGALGFNQQLEKVIFPYFDKIAKGRPLTGADFKMLGFSGNPNLIGASDSVILYNDPKVVQLNKFADMNSDGVLTVGDIRSFWNAFKNQFKYTFDVSSLPDDIKKKINRAPDSSD